MIDSSPPGRRKAHPATSTRNNNSGASRRVRIVGGIRGVRRAVLSIRVMNGIGRIGRSIFSIGVADGIRIIGVRVQIAEVSAIRSIDLGRGGKEKSCHEKGDKALHVSPPGKKVNHFQNL